MASKLRIGVIFGGRSGEHEVSLVTATSVIAALDATKYDIVPIGITKSGKWVSSDKALALLKSGGDVESQEESIILPEPTRHGLIATAAAGDGKPLDVVFPLVHGKYGEDGSLQGLLELADLPYVGAEVMASAVGMDKIVQKMLFLAVGIPVAPYVWFTANEFHEHAEAAVSQIEDVLGYPCFVKPANTGSSVGITKAHDRPELLDGVQLAMRFDRKILIEKGLPDAREIECAVLGNGDPQASVLGEVIPSNEFYDYNAKYVDGASQIVIPADLPPEVVEQVRALAIEAFRALDCAGMARVDFFVQKVSNAIILNEVNTIPGFTSFSMYPKLWEASGLEYADLLDILIKLAIERHAEKSALQTEYKPDKEWYAK